MWSWTIGRVSWDSQLTTITWLNPLLLDAQKPEVTRQLLTALFHNMVASPSPSMSSHRAYAMLWDKKVAGQLVAAAAGPSLALHYCSCSGTSPVQCHSAGTHLLSAPCTGPDRPPHTCLKPAIDCPCFPMISITIAHISIIPTNLESPRGLGPKTNVTWIQKSCVSTLTDMLADDNWLGPPEKSLMVGPLTRTHLSCRRCNKKRNRIWKCIWAICYDWF